MSRCYCAQMRAASRRLGSAYDRALAPLDINVAQYSLLRTIERLQPLSLTVLARKAQLDRSTVGRNVRVLERIGMVSLARGTDDQREAQITLSDEGVRCLEAAGPLWSNCQREIEEKLGPVKVTALQEILRSI